MLQARHLHAGYGGHQVLHDVSLTVPSGSVVALLGANGAGKTTLLRVLSGLLRPGAGEIFLDGREVTGCSPHDLVAAGVCHIPEGRGIFRSLSVRDNLRVQCRDGLEDEAVQKASTMFPVLGRRLDQAAGTLSGGEQQMLALARTSIQNPQLVLLDEVSMGLAPVVVDEIFSFLDILRRDGTSLLLVEQYVTRALAVADYVFLLHRGRIAFAGEPSELDSDEVFREYAGV